MKRRSILPRHSDGTRGFSFIELMFVIVILGVLFAVVLPKLSGSDTMPALRTTANNMARLGIYARQSAISLNEPVVMSFHKEERAWYLSLPPRDKRDKSAKRDWEQRKFDDVEDRIPGSDEEGTFFLNKRVEFEEFQVNGEPLDEDILRIWYYPNGTADTARVVLRTNEKDEEKWSRITMEVEGATGQVSAYEGEPKTFADILEEQGIDSSAYEGVSRTLKEADESLKEGRAFGVVAGSKEERVSAYSDAAARIMGKATRQYKLQKEAEENGTGTVEQK